MNTINAYTKRARAARTAVRAIERQAEDYTTEQVHRAERLAVYATRCERLATIVDRGRGTESREKAWTYAHDVGNSSKRIRGAHLATSRAANAAMDHIRDAATANDRDALRGGLAKLLTLGQGHRELGHRALRRLDALPRKRPAIDALSWLLVRQIGWDADEVEAIRNV